MCAYLVRLMLHAAIRELVNVCTFLTRCLDTHIRVLYLSSSKEHSYDAKILLMCANYLINYNV